MHSCEGCTEAVVPDPPEHAAAAAGHGCGPGRLQQGLQQPCDHLLHGWWKESALRDLIPVGLDPAQAAEALAWHLLALQVIPSAR